MLLKKSSKFSIHSIFCLIVLPSAALGQGFAAKSSGVTSLQQSKSSLVELKRADFEQSNLSQYVKSLAGQVALSIGTPVRLQMAKTISSARAKVGDRLDFVVTKNVAVNGFTVIEAGSLATGSVVEVKGRRPLGMGGKLTIRLDSARLVTGKEVELNARKVIKGGSRTKLMLVEMLATGLSYLPASPVLLLSRGNDSTGLKGLELTAYTAQSVNLPTATLLPEKMEQSQLSQMIRFLPPRAVDGQGREGDMLNLAFVAEQSDLEEAFARGGWIKTEKTRFPAFWHLAMQRTHYAKLPMRTLYVFGRTQDYSYALPDSTSVVSKRHHLRIWKTDYSVDGTPIWVGAATYDVGIQWEFRKLRIFHRIDPKIDAERDFIASRLSETKLVARKEYLQCINPVFNGVTATGGAYYSDSRMLLLGLNAGPLDEAARHVIPAVPKTSEIQASDSITVLHDVTR